MFNSLLPNKAPIFSKNDEPSYRMLYTFRKEMTEWSFSVSAYDKYVHLLQKLGTAPFLLMSNKEHVFLIEIHHETLIVITVESDTNNRVHSIVLDTEVPTAKFNIEGLLYTINNTQCESIREKFKSIQWSQEDGSPLLPLNFY